MSEDKTGKLYELLVARGNTAIEMLRHMRKVIDEFLAVQDQVDKEWQVPKEISDTQRMVIEAVRKNYAEFAQATDAEIIRHFNLTNM